MLTQYGHSSQKQPLIIDPTQLSSQKKTLLHAFLAKDEQNKPHSIKVFEPQKTYYYNKLPLQFTYTLVRQTTKLPEINYKEYSYTVYHESHLKGKGSFGSVYQVTGSLKHHINNKEMMFKLSPSRKKKVIKKQFIKSDTHQDYLHAIFLIKRENQIGQLARHTKTKKLTFKKNASGEKEAAFFVMKKFTGPFNQIINDSTVSIEKRLYMTIKLIEGLLHEIHAAGIVHRDIKPDNIFANPNNMQVNIFDFGLSRIIDDKMPCGTLLWVAPEVLAAGINNAVSDGYSMGIVIRKWWGDLSIENENKTGSHLLLNKKKRLYRAPTLAEHSKLDPAIEKELIQYLKNYPNHAAKNITQFMRILEKITYPAPKDRMTMQEALVLFAQLFYRAFSDKQKKILTIALKLKTQLYYLSFKPMAENEKLEYLKSLIRSALNKIEDNTEIIDFFLLVLDIKVLKNCHNKSNINNKITNIINETKVNLEKRNYLKNKILEYYNNKNNNIKNLKNKKNNIKNISLYKKQPIFMLDEMRRWNHHYLTHFTDPFPPRISNTSNILNKNSAQYDRPAKRASRYAIYGFVITIHLSIALAVAGFIPSGGLSMIILIGLPVLGFLIGGLIGLCVIVNDAKQSRCVKSSKTLDCSVAKNAPRNDEIPATHLQQHSLFNHTLKTNAGLEPKPQLIGCAN
jgi:serine/threonine protein kinase